MFKEFRDFAMRGNVVDLAVGVIIGAAFGKITTSLVTDVLMPPLGLLIGKMDFSELALTLKQAEPGIKAVTINYGIFLNALLNFIVTAFSMFIVIRTMNRLTTRPEPAATPTTKECPFCLSTIPLKASRCPHCTATL